MTKKKRKDPQRKNAKTETTIRDKRAKETTNMREKQLATDFEALKVDNVV